MLAPVQPMLELLLSGTRDDPQSEGGEMSMVDTSNDVDALGVLCHFGFFFLF